MNPARIIVVGGSSGSIGAIREMLAPLPAGYPFPVVVVVHVRDGLNSNLAPVLSSSLAMCVVDAEDKSRLEAGHVYVAVPGYHLLAERGATLALDAGEPLRYSRPSIDVLFETAAWAWGEQLIGVLLSGANDDGARGLALIHERGGLTIAQDPATAKAETMPAAAIARGVVDHVLAPRRIGELLLQIAGGVASSPIISRPPTA